MHLGPNGYVLVIDDQQGIRMLLTEVFRLMGLRVVTAASGREGVSVVQTANPSLILVDMKMPEMDGLDTICSIRRAKVLAPCHLMTGSEPNERVLETLKLPEVYLLSKPFDISEVRLLAHREVLGLKPEIGSSIIDHLFRHRPEGADPQFLP